jgi:beta-phosphoglucomutase-like phosphatase (HAD superfamily)
VLGGADVGSGALLLDCDGTLAETERDGHRLAFNKAFKEPDPNGSDATDFEEIQGCLVIASAHEVPNLCATSSLTTAPHGH